MKNNYPCICYPAETVHSSWDKFYDISGGTNHLFVIKENGTEYRVNYKDRLIFHIWKDSVVGKNLRQLLIQDSIQVLRFVTISAYLFEIMFKYVDSGELAHRMLQIEEDAFKRGKAEKAAEIRDLLKQLG